MQLKLLLMNADDYFHKSQTQLANLAPACQVKLRLEGVMSTTGFAKISCSCVGFCNCIADRRSYLHCNSSELSKTLKVGWLPNLY